MKLVTPSVLVLFLLSVSLAVVAGDWPRWQGAENSSQWRQGGVATTFSEGQAKEHWRVPIGLGYGGPSVVGGKIYVMDYQIRSGDLVNNPSGKSQLEGTERLLCYSLADGELLWEYSYERPYFLSYAGGPRCTPTVDSGRVYALGAEGDLICVSAETGELIWKKNLNAEYQTESPIWGHSAHPLVHGDMLYCVVGGEGSVAVAFDKVTGEEMWRALSAAEPGYCPPTIIEQAGVEQLIIWHPSAINGLNPSTGDVYWSLPLKPSYGMSIMTPRKWGDHLFASGIGAVGALIKLGTDQPTAEFAWRATPKSALFSANATPFVLGDHLYGADINSSNLICAQLSDGKRVWEDATAVVGTHPAPRGTRHGTAMLTYNPENEHFYIFNEQGHLVIAKLSPAGYEEVSRAPVLEPTNEAFGRKVVWSGAAFAGKSMIARNDKELVCIDLSE